MAETLTEEEIAEFKEIFIQYDKDGDGCIATTELGSILRALRYAPTEADLQDYISDVDPDGYGLLDFCEFISLIARRVKVGDLEDGLLEAFKVYDRDGNGYISDTELLSVMTRLGEEVTMDEVKSMIAAADSDGDGQISYKDFIRIMTEKSS